MIESINPTIPHIIHSAQVDRRIDKQTRLIDRQQTGRYGPRYDRQTDMCVARMESGYYMLAIRSQIYNATSIRAKA